MGWRTIPICDEHWVAEEGSRQAVRVVESIREKDDRCYRCGRRTDGIYVRRNVPDEAGRVDAGCARCGKQVNEKDGRTAAVILLGMTDDSMSVCIAFHLECLKEVDHINVPIRKSDGLSLIDAVIQNEPVSLYDQYTDEPDDDPVALIHDVIDHLEQVRDRREDA